jgi:ribosomal-protein-alanine N-acetyltransferase
MNKFIRENRVRLRRALPSDAEQIFEIDRVNFKTPYSLNTIIESISIDIFISAVDEADTIMGYIIGVKNYDTIDIIRLAVDDKYKRRGIGEKLLYEILREHENFDFWLEVRENNAPAIALYEKAGFERIGIRKGFYSEYEKPLDAITMKRANIITIK